MANRAKITFDLVSLTPEVTGSCLKLKYNIPNEKPIQILLDKGYYQEAKYSSLNIQKDVDFSDIDYVFLSHNHIDHSGLLPILYKNGYKHKVYCTYQTSKVLPIALTAAFINPIFIPPNFIFIYFYFIICILFLQCIILIFHF